MRTPTLQQFKTWARQHHQLAIAVCTAQAFAECKREQVDAYVKPVFDLFDFYVKPEWRKGEPGKNIGADWRILRPKDVYLTDQEADVARFFEECDKEHRKHGFTGPKGHCPALTAEHLLIKAENALIDAASPLFDMDFGATCRLENRRKLLDLLLGACLKKEAA